MKKQSSNHIFMIEPKAFYTNKETLQSNHYQQDDVDMDQEKITALAIQEFRCLRDALIENGVNVLTYKGEEKCPDHVFPNWFTTFDDKSIQIFPMMAKNRRLEKTNQMVSGLTNFYKLAADLSFEESNSRYLESTSSMVFDRVNNRVFATESPRTDKNLIAEWFKNNKFELILFETESHNGGPIYHTDVLMYIGTNVVGICFDVIKEKYRELVLESVKEHHEVIELSSPQLLDFCGNCLEVENNCGDLFLVMSTRAYKSYTGSQIQQIKKNYKGVIHRDLPVIERYGGGSARCMLAELF